MLGNSASGKDMADKDKKKSKYLSKSVKFGSKQLTLYSLDGNTWSSRKDELHQILERHDQERAAFNQMIGEAAKARDAGEEEGAEGQTVEAAEVDPIADEPEIYDAPVVKANSKQKLPAKKGKIEAAPKTKAVKPSAKPATKKTVKVKAKRKA